MRFLSQVNLSPALGNDCDVDNQVKKPLLHDMFDLLGMPMCNTGLSLFRMACRSASGPRFGGGRPSALAAAATEKWKLKRKTNGGAKKDGAAVSVTAQASAQPVPVQSSAHQSSSTNGSAGHGNKQRRAPMHYDPADLICNSSTRSPVWGNGRDWRCPADSEGDWVRVFPFEPAPSSSSSAKQPPSRSGARPSSYQTNNYTPFARPTSAVTTSTENNTSRAMIKKIQEYLRCCKKVARSCDGLSGVTDDELNDKLKDLFPAAIIPWLPHY